MTEHTSLAAFIERERELARQAMHKYFEAHPAERRSTHFYSFRHNLDLPVYRPTLESTPGWGVTVQPCAYFEQEPCVSFYTLRSPDLAVYCAVALSILSVFFFALMSKHSK